jgi:hypothetical protein
MQLELQSALYTSGIFSLQGTMAFNGITGDILGKSKNAGNAWLFSSDIRHVFLLPSTVQLIVLLCRTVVPDY